MSMEIKPDNSVKRDWIIAGAGAIGFFIILFLTGWIDKIFDFGAILNVLDFGMLAVKVAFGSALVWSIKKYVFTNTLGKDFGTTFDTGWGEMSTIEKTRWILGTFVVLFAVIMFSFK